MTTDQAITILNADQDLAAWWGEFIDPSGDVRCHHDPTELASQALDSFHQDWLDCIEGTVWSLGDVFAALVVAAGEAVEEAPDEWAPERHRR